MPVSDVLIFVPGYLLMLISMIPLIRSDYWTFRIFEYPRAQKLILNVIVLSLFVINIDVDNVHHLVFGGLLLINCGYLVYQVIPYTVVGKLQMNVNPDNSSAPSLSLMIYNVYQYNQNVEACLACIEEYDPDIVLLIETDRWWQHQVRSLEDVYPYRVMKPLENTYGMLLYSKFELVDSSIRFLIDPEVPSIHTHVKLATGQLIKLYCLHPTPPIPSENAYSTDRDAEILIVAKEAKDQKLPVIVAGDLNDVAWSYTTELFLKTSGLLDPRRGRGFYNTFHAAYLFLRWPLDHIFCSPHFYLNELQLLPNIGSDHFPLYIDLALHEEQPNYDASLEADDQDELVTDEKIDSAKG